MGRQKVRQADEIRKVVGAQWAQLAQEKDNWRSMEDASGRLMMIMLYNTIEAYAALYSILSFPSSSPPRSHHLFCGAGGLTVLLSPLLTVTSLPLHLVIPHHGRAIVYPLLSSFSSCSPSHHTSPPSFLSHSLAKRYYTRLYYASLCLPSFPPPQPHFPFPSSAHGYVYMEANELQYLL